MKKVHMNKINTKNNIEQFSYEVKIWLKKLSLKNIRIGRMKRETALNVIKCTLTFTVLLLSRIKINFQYLKTNQKFPGGCQLKTLPLVVSRSLHVPL